MPVGVFFWTCKKQETPYGLPCPFTRGLAALEAEDSNKDEMNKQDGIYSTSFFEVAGANGQKIK